MLRLIIFFQLLALGMACSFKKKVVSEWKVLENADSVTCGEWPQNPKDLNVQRVQILKGDHIGFVSEVLQRNGTKQYYYSEYDGGVKVSPDDLESRDFGSRAYLAGGGFFDNRLQAVVVVNGERNNSRVEIRSLKDNVIRFSTADNLRSVQAASSYQSKSGLWMVYKPSEEDRSESDMLHNVYYVPIDAKAQKVNFESFKSVSFPSQTQFLVPKKSQGYAFAVWSLHDSGKKELTFAMQQLQTKNTSLSPLRKIELPLRYSLESWTAVANDDSIYVAYVDGDSLIGQAVLKIARIRWNDGSPLLAWSKESMLTNEHVSMPVWGMAKNDQLYVMLPKWVDEESTIATYKVNSEGIGEKQVKGIFDKGIRIMDSFYDVENEKLVAILRQKGRLGWDFQLCELSL